jgi:hypothetical protein
MVFVMKLSVLWEEGFTFYNNSYKVKFSLRERGHWGD